MTAYLLHDKQGVAVSIGSVVADPLPAGITAVKLTDTEFAGLTGGTLRWNGTALEPAPAPVDPEVALAERVAAIENAITTATGFSDLKAKLAKPKPK